jgi:DNA-binding NarL/FixJ family response regulator
MDASSTPLRLLVIEHQPGLRQIVRRWVEGLDCVICECVSPTEALHVGAELHPDWVVVDAQLKPDTGLAAVRTLKPRFPNARFVLVSDFDDDPLRKAAWGAGSYAFLLKEDLAALRNLLSDTRNSVHGQPGKSTNHKTPLEILSYENNESHPSL